MTSKEARKWTRAEVAADPNVVLVDGYVYDISKFATVHPGGEALLRSHGGQDVSEIFKVYHSDLVLPKRHERLCVGHVEGEISRQPVEVPYGDPLWYSRFNSPYYTASHVEWRNRVRQFVETRVMPGMEDWVSDYKGAPRALQLACGEEGFLAALTGNLAVAKTYLDPHVAAKIPTDYDVFHELILVDEFARVGSSAAFAALTNGPAIALSAILAYGSPAMQARVCPDVLAGRANIALAISEPQAGSDVAGLVTSAKRQADGSFVVSGLKKYITNGVYSDYFVTAVRTGSKGHGGLSFLLVERKMEGFSSRKLPVRASEASGTAFLNFHNVRVPRENLIGREGEGFKLVTHNFNHERVYLSISAARFSRICLEESLQYAARREAFGKPLAEMQSVRMRLSEMAIQIEQLYCWIEHTMYQMQTMPKHKANVELGDYIALLKAQSSRVYEACAAHTTHIFGGNALFVNGVGRNIETAVSQVKGIQIPAGAEDTMLDFAGRVMVKRLQKAKKQQQAKL